MIYFVTTALIITLGFILGFFKNKWLQIAADTFTWLGTLAVLFICYDVLQAVVYVINLLAGRVI